MLKFNFNGSWEAQPGLGSTKLFRIQKISQRRRRTCSQIPVNGATNGAAGPPRPGKNKRASDALMDYVRYRSTPNSLRGAPAPTPAPGYRRVSGDLITSGGFEERHATGRTLVYSLGHEHDDVPGQTGRQLS